MFFDPSRALITYSGLVTLALLWLLLTGATTPRTVSFDTLEVHRINIRESDGTLRLVLASRDHFPGAFSHKREIKRPDRDDVAGMLFLNDEGTENGGLVFGGHKINGKVIGFGHLSFDQYEQDQVINLEQSEVAGQRHGGLTISDYPDASMVAELERLQKLPVADRAIEYRKVEATGIFEHRERLFVGKADNRDSLLTLSDGNGRPRLQLRVTLAGAASIQFLDENGKVTRTVAPAELTKDSTAR